MPEGERTEVARRAFEAAERSDREALFALLKPGVEWQMIGLLGDRQPVYRGREEIWAYVCALHERFEDFGAELLDVDEVGDQVVGRVRVHGRPHDEEIELMFSTVMRVRDGRIVRADNYEDHDEALTDAELRVDSAS